MFCIVVRSNYYKQISKAAGWRYSVKKVFFKNFAKFTGMHPSGSLCLSKVPSWRPVTLLKGESSIGISSEF